MRVVERGMALPSDVRNSRESGVKQFDFPRPENLSAVYELIRATIETAARFNQ
jgi:hypothetical protein